MSANWSWYRWVVGMLLALAACSDLPQTIESSGPEPPQSPPTQSSVWVAVKGDWGFGSEAQARVTELMCATRRARHFTNVLTTGDNFYNPDGIATPRNYGRPEKCLIEDPHHRWRAVWGNHDVGGDSTTRILGAPHNQAWSLGRVRFISLDSNLVEDAKQTAWLRKLLREDRETATVVALHHPPYTAGSHHPSDLAVRKRWVALFEKSGVVLVLAGHAHLYEHHVVNGIHYVVTGGGGATLHACARRPTSLRMCVASYHFLLLGLGQRHLEVEAIGAYGKTLEAFKIAI